jgi:hypothetical protein
VGILASGRCGVRPNRVGAAGRMQPHHIYAGICIDMSDLWTIPVTILALERAQNTTNDKNMRDQIEHSIKIITRIIDSSANTESNTQSTSEFAVEQKTQAKIDKLHEKINAKFDQIIKFIQEKSNSDFQSTGSIQSTT